MSNDLIYFSFLKKIRRYGSWRYNLIDPDYIYVARHRISDPCDVIVCVDGTGIGEVYHVDALEDAYKIVSTTIAKYEAEHTTDTVVKP